MTTSTNSLCQRALCAFKTSNRRWTPVSSRHALNQFTHHPEPGPSRVKFSLLTQNLDAFSPRPVVRAKQLLNGILKERSNSDRQRPDIVFLQEVTSDVRSSILENPSVRDAFLVTDAEDGTSFEGVPFANMVLLSNKRFAIDDSELEREKGGGFEKFMLGLVSRVKLASKYGRCVLSLDITPPSRPNIFYRLINVHLDSLWETFLYRTEQMEILANLLREPGCGGGLIAGDFNAMRPEDHALINKNGLTDAWVALHGNQGLDGGT